MKRGTLISLLMILMMFSGSGQTLVLQQYATGFTRPVDIANAGDDRLFIVEQAGIIRIIDGSGTVLATPFLNISGIVNDDENEQGLLGLVFHPNYSTNGLFYVHYTRSDDASVIARYRVSTDPNVANTTGSVIMTVPQPYWNHNAGDLAFGGDGYLYIAMGDGGSGGDPGDRAQDPQELLGKILRIDVNSGLPYSIPPSNPFVGDASTLDEIWSLGWRNPWRFSFDKLTGDMWVGDVGQGDWEEISYEPSGTGGRNYGWRCYEGDDPYNLAGCGPIGNYVFPAIDYPSTGTNSGCSVTGGFVYRGSLYPNFYGKYIYTDYCSGIFWMLQPNGGGGWINTFLADLSNWQFSTFGEDHNCELYVAALGQGTIYQVVDDSVVPVQLTHFNAKANNIGSVELNWASSSEVGLENYELQRRSKGSKFSTIYKVLSQKDSNTESQYRFTDRYPHNGMNEYRLKMNFTDGTKEYSGVEIIEIRDRQQLELNIYPNPAQKHQQIAVEFKGTANKAFIISIHSANGQLVHQKRMVSLDDNHLKYTIPLLESGIYHALIQQDGKRLIKKFIQF